MRIKELEFENINSLSGHWKIDFTDKIFDDFGRLFTISGPTGAGKTTILDAICLALYARTPRQETVNKKGNEVMTWGETSCYSKVTFESNGKTYVCGWEQSYTRNKTLNDYKRSLFLIEDDGTQKNLGGTKKDLYNQIVKIIGLDFEQFTQAVLLPQGDFARFLSCETKERTEILEKLSGGEKYRMIAQKAHEHYREEETKLRKLQDELGDIEQKCLSDEQIEQIKNELSDKNADLEKIKQTQNKIIEQKQWRKNLEKIGNDYENAQTEFENAKEANENFQEQREMLNLARTVTKLLPQFSILKKSREAKIAKERENEISTRQLEELKKNETSLREAKNQAVDFYNATEQERNEALPIWDEVLKLDEQVVNSKKRYNEAAAEEQKLNKQLQNARLQINGVSQNIATLRNDEVKESEYLEKSAADERLVEALEAWQERAKHFAGQKIEIDTLQQNIDKYENELSVLRAEKEKAIETESKQRNYQKNNIADGGLSAIFSALQVETENIRIDLKKIVKLQSELNETQTQLDEKQKKLDDAQQLCDIAQKKLDGLHTDEIGKISAFLRAYLQDGDNCPVCGGKYSSTTKETSDLQDGIHILVQHIENVQKEKEKATSYLRECQENMNETLRNVQNYQKQYDESTQAVQEALAKLSGKLAEFGFDDFKKADIKTVSQELENTMKKLELRKIKWEESQKELETATSFLNEKNASEKSLTENITAKKNELADKMKSFESDWNELKNILSTWKTDVTQAELDDVMQMLRNRKAAWCSHKNNHDAIRQKIVQLQTELSEKNIFLDGLESELALKSEVTKNAENENQTIYQKRVELFGTKVLKDEKRKLDEKLQVAKDKKESCEAAFMRFEKSLNEVIAKKESITSDLEKISGELQTNEATFIRAYKEYGFDDEMAVETAAKIDREALEAKENEIKSRFDKTQEALRICKKNFEDEKNRALTDKSIEQLDKEFTECETNMQNINSGISELNYKLMSHNDNMKTFGEKRKALDEQKKSCEKWGKMKQLMGTADGETFAKFVQSITLKQLIVEANLHLRRITQRYQLITDSKEDLSLYLIDHDLGNEKRSVSNLSGGEKFLVSLSLALGLSSMASRKIKIDTLFLDEGFGTLDAQALASTINMLQTQQQESGKMLGIITHVETLKDEFPLRIEVKKKGQGISVLEGPGISR
jgi:exonuclease SbcC